MRYNIHIPSTVTAAGNDLITIVSGSKRSVLVCEIDLEGAELSGAFLDMGFFLVPSTPGSTGGGAIVPQPIGNPNLTGSNPVIAFSGSVFTTWSSQPVVASDAVHPTPINANGQRYYWATENTEDMISIPGGGGAAGTLSLRVISTSGSHIAGRIKIIEP